MGKIVTVYLSDEDVIELKNFCNKNQCTQYSALKTAVKELLYKPIKEVEETKAINIGDENPEKSSESETLEELIEKKNPANDDFKPLHALLLSLVKKAN